MIQSRINYLLAACAHRVGRGGSAFPGKECLRAHLHELAKTDTSQLAQITIIRALPLIRNGNFRRATGYYWNARAVDAQFRCPIVTLDVKDHCFSYSSWVQAIMRWRTEFDYYILIEDDFYPSHPQFVERLIAEHTRKLPQGGFLCGFATNHAASANGIVDSITFVKSLDKLSDPVLESGKGQGDFARTFCDDRVTDYTDRYRCLSPSNEIVELVHVNRDNVLLYPVMTEDLIRPLEYLLTGERAFPTARSKPS